MKTLGILAMVLLLSTASYGQRDIDFFEPDFDTSYCRHYTMYFQQIGAQNMTPHYWPMPYHISQFISKSAARYHIKTVEKRMVESESAFSNEFQSFDDKGRLTSLKTITKSKHSEKIDTVFEKYVYSEDSRRITVFDIMHDRDTVHTRSVWFGEDMAVIRADIIMDTMVNPCSWSSTYIYDKSGFVSQVADEDINCKSKKRRVVYDAGNTRRSYDFSGKPAASNSDTTLINYFKVDNVDSSNFLKNQLDLGKPIFGTVSTSNPQPADHDDNAAKQAFSNFVHVGQSDVFGINHVHTSDSVSGFYNCDVSANYYKWDKEGRIQYYYNGRYFMTGPVNNSGASEGLMYGYEIYDAARHTLKSSRYNYDFTHHQRKNEKAKELTTSYTTYPTTDLPLQVDLAKKYTYSYTFYK